MANLSSGQQDALRDLAALQNTSDYSIEVISHKRGAKGALLVDISIECRGVDYRTPGLRLRDRERFWMVIDSQFPLEPPNVFAQDHRFAFHDHVYWAGDLGVWLCLYYSIEHQWQPTLGIAGFLWRLLQWLERAGIGELDAPGQPRHPPLAGGAEDDAFFVVREDCPTFEYAWGGFAVLENKGARRFDIVGWTDEARRHKTDTLSPAILLNTTFVSEFPDYVSSLMILLRRAGADERVLAERLLLHAIYTNKRQPMYVVLGVAMRGPKGEVADQHLFVWKIPDRTANDLRNLCRKYKRLNAKTIEHFLSKGELIIAEWCKSTERLIHCRVYDQRPAVSRRRDENTPVSSLKGKSVTLWGVGGLGSHIAEMLVRASVQTLRIVDFGRVNPGILVRQNYVDEDIGDRKVDALCRRLRKLDPKVTIEPICANLLKNAFKTSASLKDTDLLIDATASRRVAMTLDRYLLDQGEQAFPIVSVGNDVIAERGLITATPAKSPLGPTDILHRAFLALCELNNDVWLDAFWPSTSEDDWFEPEPGCSSPTFHGSAAHTASLAGSMLTEAAKLLTNIAQPTVVGISPFYSEETDVLLQFETGRQGTCPVTGDAIRFFPQAIRIIDQTISASEKNKETGGILFGFRDDYLKIVWVVAATGPPPDSKASTSDFVCGVEGVTEATSNWLKNTHNLVGFIGTWHSHPVSEATPSVTDLKAMKALLTQSGSPLHRLLLTIVGYSASEPQFGTFVFHDEDGVDDQEESAE